MTGPQKFMIALSYTWRLEEVRTVCEANGWPNYTVLQQRFSYLFARGGIQRPYPYNENAGMEKLRYLAKHNIPLVAYSCMSGGGYQDNSRLPEFYLKGERLAVLNTMAKEKGLPAAALVIAWMRHSQRFADRPQIIPLFSTGNLSHLKENVKACRISLTNREMNILNEA